MYQRYRWFYKGVYWVYAKCQLKLFSESTVITIAATVVALCAYSVFKVRYEDIQEYLVGAGLLAGLFLLFVVSKLYTNKIMASSGGKYINDIKTYFEKQKPHGLYKLVNISDESLHCRFATPKEAELTATLYAKAFRNTPWDYDTKDRNATHLDKNDQSILLICTKEGSPVGFTHVVAVNYDVWQRYKTGNISDAKLDGNDIAPKIAILNDEYPHGIILFTVALSETHKDFKLEPKKDYKKKVGDILLKAAAYHIDHFLKREFVNQRNIPVLFHTMRDNVIKQFKDHMTNGREYSKDNARIICFNLRNHHILE